MPCLCFDAFEAKLKFGLYFNLVINYNLSENWNL